MALTLLLDNRNIDRDSFEIIIQGLSPYSDDSLKTAIRHNAISIQDMEASIQNIDVQVPTQLSEQSDITFDLFKTYFKSSKNTESTSRKYYNFFIALKNFRGNPIQENYADLKTFLQKNNNHPWMVFRKDVASSKRK